MAKRAKRQKAKSKQEARLNRLVDRFAEAMEGGRSKLRPFEYLEMFALARELGMAEEDTAAAKKPPPRVIPFLDRAFRLKKATGLSRHVLGGRGQMPAPGCGACQNPLMLFANLDAKSREISCPDGLSRIPLYYCCRCPGPVYYTVDRGGRIAPIRTRLTTGEEAPFANPPGQLPRGGLTLIPISEELNEAITVRFSGIHFGQLSKSQLKEIVKLTGKRPIDWFDMHFSQLGGFPRAYQGGEESTPRICPNKNCPIRRRTRTEFKYRPLAVLDLWNDKFWRITPLDAVQIVFSICPGCFTIAAKYTCT